MAALTCTHCLISFPARQAVYTAADGKQTPFCCSGCRGIYLLIHNESLDAFYRDRSWSEPGIRSATQRLTDVREFADSVHSSNGKNAVSLYIDGIRCASCVWLNEKILGRIPGVEHARVNYATHEAMVRWDPAVVGLDRILQGIQSIGYIPRPFAASMHQKAQKAEARDLLIRFGTAAFFSSQLMVYSTALYAGYFQGIDHDTKLILEIIALLLTLPVLLYAGMPFLRNTVRGLLHGHFTMDALITLGAWSAFVYSLFEIAIGGKVYFDTAAMIITLILLGRYLEIRAKGKASEAIERLAALAPPQARVVSSPDKFEEGERAMVALASVEKDALIEVIPGERVPLDGVVVTGDSEVDESLITGESRPQHKRPGSEVIGGSTNLFGAFIFRATRTGSESTLAGIIRAVQDAQAAKPPLQRLADRIVGVFVPVVVALAAATVAWYLTKGSPANVALMAGTSVLVIACPCSLGLATPLAVLMFTMRASSRGIVITNGDVVERAACASHVFLDKTGTITVGNQALKRIIVIDPRLDQQRIMALAASLERVSEHSIGRAIVAASDMAFLPVDGVAAIPGRGIEGSVAGRHVLIGNWTLMVERGVCFSPDLTDRVARPSAADDSDTVVYAAVDRQLAAVFIVSDLLREEATAVIAELKDMGMAITIMSGDNNRTTTAIARFLHVANAVGEVSPQEKKGAVDREQMRGAKVIMVGDGINDAPALTAAEVGIAMGRRADIAIECADAVIMREDLRLVPFFLRLSAKTYWLIKQNIFWAFFYNIVAIPLAVAGLLHPILAAVAMAASSLFVVFNSLRIGRFV